MALVGCSAHFGRPVQIYLSKTRREKVGELCSYFLWPGSTQCLQVQCQCKTKEHEINNVAFISEYGMTVHLKINRIIE